MTHWIGSGVFSLATGISERKVRRALARAAYDKPWRGHVLEVRTVEGRGGKSGLQYQVKVSSLPAHIQDRLSALQIAFEDPSKTRLWPA